MSTTSTSVDDRDSSIVYNGVWSTGEQDDLYDGTDNFSAQQGANIVFHFHGTGVEYWGNDYNTHGPCLINLDGTSYGTVTSFATTRGPPRNLWSLNNLVLTDHTLTITVQSSGDINRCELDRFVVNVAPSSSTPPLVQSTTHTSSSPSTSSPTSGSSSGSRSTTTTSSTGVSSTGESSAGGSSGSPSHSSTTSLITAAVAITLPNGVVETTTMPIGTSVADVSTKSSPTVSIGTIVGAIIGSFALILFILFFWLWYRRSNRREVPDLDSFVNESNVGSIAPLRSSSTKGIRSDPGDSMSYSGQSSVRRLTETVAPSQSAGQGSSVVSEEPPEEAIFHMPPPAYER